MKTLALVYFLRKTIVRGFFGGQGGGVTFLLEEDLKKGS